MIYIVSGTQWGDEGKAKVIDYFAGDFDYVVRYQGGANAGHTVFTGNKKYVFHLIPSGILHKDVSVVIGNGVVLDIQELLKEIEMVSKDTDVRGRLLISNKANIVMPYHKLLDKAQESKSSNAIGTTQRGIGPAYVDKVDRLGIRAADLLSPRNVLREKIAKAYEVKEYLFKNYYHLDSIPTVDSLCDEVLAFVPKIKDYITDTEKVLQEARKVRKNILFEGAQGSLLDVDFGTYPYVTSSNTIAPAAITGSGIGAFDTANVIGIAKAYITRVGEGPFPTELKDEIGENIRTVGKEFGATTGRPRRCGWFDAVATRYALGVCGVMEIFLTKLDVLDGMDELMVCTKYILKDGTETDYFPATIEELEGVKPFYQTVPGWKEKTFGVRNYHQLPDNAKKYIDFLEFQIGTKISYISTGFEREDVIVR
jgi:adenylosuccinate synthase